MPRTNILPEWISRWRDPNGGKINDSETTVWNYSLYIKTDQSDSGSLCHGSNPCFAIFLPLLRSKQGRLGVSIRAEVFHILHLQGARLFAISEQSEVDVRTTLQRIWEIWMRNPRLEHFLGSMI
jgi:hypothetical protein